MDKYPLYRTGATGYNGTGKGTRYERSTIFPLPRSKRKEGEGEMSDEYITRNNAISAVCFGCNKQFSNEPCEPSECTIRQSIMALPLANVVEIKHGYWKWEKKIEPQAQNRLYCSVCDNECLGKNNYYVKSDYCPHCFARMDGSPLNDEVRD